MNLCRKEYIIRNYLYPITREYHVCSESLQKLFLDDPSLSDTLAQIFLLADTSEERKFLLTPLRMLNSEFSDEVLHKVGKKFSDISLDGDFIHSLILSKIDIYRDVKEQGIEEYDFSNDYFERVALMVLDSDCINNLTTLYQENGLDIFEYIATRFHCAEFVASFRKICDPCSFMREHYDLLLNSNPELLEVFVDSNISAYYGGQDTFSVEDIEEIVPPYHGTSISSNEFRNLLEFSYYRLSETKDDKLSLFSLLSSYYKAYDSERVTSFLHQLCYAPDSFFTFLANHMEQEEEIDDLLVSQIDPFCEGVSIFKHLGFIPDDKKEAVYSLLLTKQFPLFSLEKKVRLLDTLKDYETDAIESLYSELNDDATEFNKVDDLCNFEKLFHFLSSDTRKEFCNKMSAIKAISSQLDAKYLDLYLHYLEKSNLRKKREYKAHSAYFKNHSIDTFFDDFQYGTWKEDLLVMNTDDKKVKKQQLKLIANCPVSQLTPKLFEHLSFAFSYSDDIEDIKNVVRLVVNPLFSELSYDKQLALINHYPDSFCHATIGKEEQEIDIIIPNLDSSLEQLPDEGFVKCKGRGRDGSIEVLVRKSRK